MSSDMDRVIRLLRSTSPEERCQGILAAYNDGAIIGDAVDYVKKLARDDSSADVRKYAFKFCAQLPPAESFETLAMATQDAEEKHVRIEAAKVLSQMETWTFKFPPDIIILWPQYKGLLGKCIEVLRSAEKNDHEAKYCRFILGDESVLTDVYFLLWKFFSEYGPKHETIVAHTISFIPKFYKSQGFIWKIMFRQLLRKIGKNTGSYADYKEAVEKATNEIVTH